MSKDRLLKNQIQDLRTSFGYTQEKLADLVGVTRQTIIAIERGNYVPSLVLAIELGRVFKTPIEKLFWYEK